MKFEYDAVIMGTGGNGGAYVAFPYDLRSLFGKGRVKAHAEFDGMPYDGSIVNMGVKNPDGSVCWVIGVLKEIRKALGKGSGDRVHVLIEVSEEPRPAAGPDGRTGDEWKTA